MFGRISVGSILLVFYLYLLVRGEHVKRPMLLLIGFGGLLFGLLGTFFALGDSDGLKTAAAVLGIIGSLVAFVCAVGACYAGELPIKLAGSLDTPAGSKEPSEAE